MMQRSDGTRHKSEAGAEVGEGKFQMEAIAQIFAAKSAACNHI